MGGCWKRESHGGLMMCDLDCLESLEGRLGEWENGVERGGKVGWRGIGGVGEEDCF